MNPPDGYEVDLQATTASEIVMKQVSEPEPEAKPDYPEAAEKLFLELMQGMVIHEQNRFPDSVFWENKNGEIIFQQDKMNMYLWCHYCKIWEKFYPFFDNNYNKVSDFIRDRMGKHLKWMGFIPLKTTLQYASWWKNI